MMMTKGHRNFETRVQMYDLCISVDGSAGKLRSNMAASTHVAERKYSDQA